MDGKELSQVTCARCSGTGWLTCPDCKGRGIYYQGGGFWTSIPARGLVCPRCLGKGVLGKCEFCNGTGRIERSDEAPNSVPSALGLSVDSYDFSEGQVRSTVERGRVGNYALGFSAMHGDTNTRVFHPTFIGRSDTDLQEDLLSLLAKKKPWYSRFKFSYATTVKEAFEKECRDFHLAIGVIDNEKHPEPPTGTDFPCPVPSCNALKS